MATKKKIKYVAYVAASIDGRISESSRSKLDWTSQEDWDFFQKSLQGFDAVVVGYNTYKTAESRLKKRNTIVFTSKGDNIKKAKPKSVIFFDPGKSDFQKYIGEQGYKKIAILGGPKVYNFFLKRGILHELYLTVEPYVFTAGVPMFSGDEFKKYKFSLERITKLNKKGTILLKYKYGSR